MDDLEQRLRVLLDEAVPEPRHRLDVEEIRALTRFPRASPRGRMRRAARRRRTSGDRAADRRGRFAVAAAIAAAVIIVFGTFLVGRVVNRSNVAPGTTATSATTAAPGSTDVAALNSTSWELTRVVDAAGKVPAPASARVVFTFEKGYVVNDVGDSASARISTGRVQFGRWGNSMSGGNPTPRLDKAQSSFVFALLSGAVTWSVDGDTLTMARPGRGFLVFARSTRNAALGRAYGVASGRFFAVGGPSRSGAPRPQTGVGTVQFRDNDTGRTQTVDTGSDGTYRTTLVPGRYTVDGHISTYQDGRAACPAQQPITVDKDGTTKVDLYCEEK